MQRSINGLKAGTTYLIQVRSTSVQGTSEWSPVTEEYIPIPVITPNAPTNVTATGNPDNIKISWTQATLNTDNTNISQPAYYQVYRESIYNPIELVGKTSSSSFTYQTVLYGVNQTFSVRTVDGFGNLSATSNTASSTALSPAVMNGLIEKLDSYSRPTGSTVATFNTVRSHNLQNGDYVFIYGTTGGTNNFDTPSTTGATAGVPVTYISDTSFSCSPNTSTEFLSAGTGAPGDMYPTEDAVRIRTDGITIGNMRTKHIVGIAPTSFNMQSADTGTRMAISSDGISMFRATGSTEEQTVSLVSASGDATIVGKFSTGFSPNARVELDSGSTTPESIKFYSGDEWEENSGSVASDDYYATYSNASIAEVSSLSNNTYVPAAASTPNIAQESGSFPAAVNSIYSFRTSPVNQAYDFPYTGYLDVSTDLGIRTFYYQSCVTPTTTNTTSDLTLPLSDATINVTSTTSYETSGQLAVGGTLVTYTGKTASTFTGCSSSGTGTITSGASVDGQSEFAVISTNETWTPVVNTQVGVRLYVTASTSANAFPLAALKDSVDAGSIYRLYLPVAMSGGNAGFSYIGVQKTSTTAISINTIGSLIGGTARTATLASAHTFKINDKITIASVLPAAINGSYTVTAVPTATSFTYATTVANAYTSTGNVRLLPSIRGIALSSGSSNYGGTALTGHEIEVLPAAKAVTISAPSVVDYADAVYSGSSAVFSGGASYNGYVVADNDTINLTAKNLLKNTVSPIKASVGGILTTTSTDAVTTVTHRLGVTPSAVVASVRSNTHGDGTHVHAYTGGYTATTFTIYTTFTNSVGSTTGSTSAVSWIAIE